MTVVRVLSPGLSTLQDGGRHGYAKFGVPSSGAFDAESYALLSNLFAAPGVACVEVLDGEFRIRPEGGDVEVAVIRGDASFANEKGILPEGVVCWLHDGQEVLIRKNGAGPVYVGIFGLVVEPVLESSSFDTLSRLGPPPLCSGQALMVENKTSGRVGAFLAPNKEGGSSRVFRVTPSPHFDEAITETQWSVVAVSRSGIRITPHTEVDIRGGGSLSSIPVHPGCIQVPYSDEAIILGPDSGVTGGYAVAATVISADLAKMSRLAEGENVSFVLVDVEEALRAWSALQHRLSTGVVALH